MANALTLVGKTILPHEVVWRFTCQLSGSYTNSGAVGNVGTAGETLNFNGAANPNKLARPKIPSGPPAARLPLSSDIKLFLPLGYDGEVEQNAVAPTPANFILRLFTTAGTELGNGGYSAALAAYPFLIEVRAPLRYN